MRLLAYAATVSVLAAGCSGSSGGSGVRGDGGMTYGVGGSSAPAPCPVAKAISGTDPTGHWCSYDVATDSECKEKPPLSFYAEFTSGVGGMLIGELCWGYQQQCGSFGCTESAGVITCPLGEPGRNLVVHFEGGGLNGTVTGCTTCDTMPCLCDLPVHLCKI